MHLRPTFLLAPLLLLAGCEQAQEAKNAYSVVTHAAEASKQMGAALQDAQTRQTERARRGDTLALPYKELQQYLPAAVPGFATADAPAGQAMQMPGMHYSQATRAYHAGNQQLTVTLVDYNGAATLFTAASGLMALGMEMEDDNQRMNSADLGQPGLKALETYGKQDRKASIVVAVNDRFIATVEANDQPGTEAVEAVAKSLNYAELLKK